MNNQVDDKPQVQQTSGAQQVSSTQPQVPMGIGNKEAGPVSEAPLTEYVSPSPAEQEPVIPTEVKEYGVEQAPSEKAQLTQAQKALDIKLEKEETPLVISDSQQQRVIHSLTQQQAEEKLKSSSNDESVHWLAALIIKQFAQAV